MFKKILYVLIIIGLVFGAIGFQTPKPVQAANPLRISQVYANSGMQTSFYKQNYVELFNSSSSPISLAGYSLQFGTGSGKIDLFNAPMPEKTIPAGGYLLIQTFDFEVGQSSIPTPDVTLIVNVDNVSGKIALVNGTEALDCGSVEVPCSDEQKARIVDMVGYGPHASFYEGSAAAPSPTVILSVQRKAAGCQDTDQNGADFETLTPAARNSASPTHSCQPLGDPANLRLSQVYGGGGGANATYTHDFIEIFNAGSAPVSLDGLSLQYASATGTGNFGASAAQLTELPNVTLEAGQYFLVEQASGTNGVALPTPDYIDPTPIGMSATNGKVALVTGTTTLGCNGGSTPCNADQTARIIDLVGFGNANFYEGTQAAPVLSSTLSAQRKQGGCQDTDQNGDDFEELAPNARNSASPAHSCAPAGNPDAIFFSEYIEGSSSNKAVEIYNGTGAELDLTDIKVELYTNGNSTINNQVTLTGTLADKGVFVIANSSASQAIKDKANLLNAVTNYNGDDALVLRRVSSGAVLDSIGQVGFDPGTKWGDGDVQTVDRTLVRKPEVCTGDTIPDDVYTVDEWLGYPQDIIEHLGSHESTCNQAPIPGPKVQSIVPANNAVVPGTTDIVITFSETVTVAEGWYNITCTQPGAHTAVVTDANPVFTLNPDTDFTSGETCTVTIDKDKVTNAANETMAENYVSSFSIVEGCGDAFTAIYAIQGDGAASPVVNEIVTTEGVVTANFQVGGKKGYTIQDPEGDNNPATSDGIFVYSISPEINVGDRLRITGKVTEYFNMTQLTPTSAATVLTCSTGHEVTPAEITLPVTAPRDFEQYEGMLVTFPQYLTISEYFNYDRYGEIVLSGTRHNTPTSVVEPGEEAVAAEQAYILDSIKVDDTLTTQNPPYLRHPDGTQFTKEHYFRGGDAVYGLTGIMDYNFNEWKIQPVGEATFAQMNLRPEAPSLAPGEIRIASMNVLNYFVTLDNAGNICGPGGNVNCRGADTPEEFERQHTKIVKAIVGMEADVIGLMEIENEHPAMEADGAVKNLVEGLNASAGEGTYAYVPTGVIGTDAIKQALIYKPAKVDFVGTFATLDETFDPAFDTTKNRPSLAASFKDKITNEIFTVSVNHLKSKGSACEGDPDLGDGQGNCNLTRKAAAEALVKWLETDPTQAGSGMYVIIGDLNSYAKEDPIDAIKLGADKTADTADDVINLVERFNEPEVYGYVFDGKAGYLDHALANKKFASYVLDAAFWNINADEADVFDYDNSFKPAEQAALYSPDAYRSSDHDPVLISLILNHPPVATDDEYTTDVNTTLEVASPGVMTNDTDANEYDRKWVEKVEGSGPAHGDLTLQPDGSFVYIPEIDFVGMDTFEYIFHAIPGLMADYSDTATVTINVVSDNHAPVITYPIEGASVDELGGIEIQITATDSDTPAQTITLSIENLPEGAVFDETTGKFEWEPTEAQGPGEYILTIKACDNGVPVLCATMDWKITVNEVNIAPRIYPIIEDIVVDELETIDFEVPVVDEDIPVNVLTITLIDPPEGAQIVEGRFTWTPTEEQGPGEYDITIKVCDDADPALCDEDTFKVTVNEVNIAPELDPLTNVEIPVHVAFTFTATGTDVDFPAQTLTYSLVGAPAGAVIDETTGDFTWTPDWDDLGPKTFQVCISDGELEDCKDITLTVLNVNTLDEEIRTAPDYVYDPVYEYGGDFEFNDEENIYTVTYKPAQVLAGKPTADIARYLGALYRQDGATVNGIKFNGVDYTWKINPPAAPELKGSNWRDADNNTLVSAIGAYMMSSSYDPEAGFTLTVTDGYNTETVTFIVVITNTLDAEIGSGFDYEYDPAYTYIGAREFDDLTNVYTVTYPETHVAPHAMNDLARYLGALHRQDEATIIAIAYKGTTYTWNAEGTLLGSNWKDEDGITLVSVITADFLAGTIDPATGIVLTVSDGIHTETVTFKMIITNVAPVLDPIEGATIPELEAYTFTATASDVPTATLTFSLVGAPEGAMIDDLTGVFTWTPTEAQGPEAYTFIVKVCDDGTPVLCDEQELTLNVTEVNVAPVLAEIGDKEVVAGTQLTFTATATDEDIPVQSLTFSLKTAPTGATIDGTTGVFTWTPTAEQVGEHTFEVCVTDGVAEVCEEITITVVANDPPVAVDDIYTTAEDVVLTVAAPGVLTNDSDPNGDAITAEVVGQPAHGTVVLAADGGFVYTPNENWFGSDSFTYKAKDAELYSNIATVSITVTPVNDAPELDPINDATMPEMEPIGIMASVYDPDSENFTYSLINGPEGATIHTELGIFAWTPTEEQGPGVYTFSIKVCDDGTPSLCDQEEVTLTIDEVNLAPEIEAIEDKEVTAGEELTFTAEASDPDLPANTLTFRLEGAPTGATIDGTTGVFTWTPTAEQVGEHTFEVCVTDGNLNDCTSVKVTVLPAHVNTAPVAVADAYEIDQDEVLTVDAPGVLANDTDEDDDDLTAVLVVTTENGTLVLKADGSFVYTPDEGFFGTDTFTYKANDGEADSNVVTVTITVKKAEPVLPKGLFFPIIFNKGF